MSTAARTRPRRINNVHDALEALMYDSVSSALDILPSPRKDKLDQGPAVIFTVREFNVMPICGRVFTNLVERPDDYKWKNGDIDASTIFTAIEPTEISGRPNWRIYLVYVG